MAGFPHVRCMPRSRGKGGGRGDIPRSSSVRCSRPDAAVGELMPGRLGACYFQVSTCCRFCRLPSSTAPQLVETVQPPLATAACTRRRTRLLRRLPPSFNTRQPGRCRAGPRRGQQQVPFSSRSVLPLQPLMSSNIAGRHHCRRTLGRKPMHGPHACTRRARLRSRCTPLLGMLLPLSWLMCNTAGAG